VLDDTRAVFCDHVAARSSARCLQITVVGAKIGKFRRVETQAA
jgi:hypothetical protein